MLPPIHKRSGEGEPADTILSTPGILEKHYAPVQEEVAEDTPKWVPEKTDGVAVDPCDCEGTHFIGCRK